MKKFEMPSLFLLFLVVNVQCNSSNAAYEKSASSAGSYRCMPCGRDCDNDVYDKPGKCPHCQMDLVEKSTVHFKTIQPSMLCQYIADHPNVVLLDVRTKEEFEGKADPNYGTLKNAINVPVQELEKNISTLVPYKDKEIIVYCSHSHRSPRACYILTQNGFSNVTNMAGGMSVMKDNSCMK
jgi:rhodanese-related sulfurtransferase/DNA-directed RNA polymerase subunit RPC12/RpoP